MFLGFFVFVCGAAVMVLEIVGARFFAPHIGTSVVIWSSIIGVVMAGLSVGYALGGMAGDRWRSMGRLRAMAGLAGAWILLVALFREPVLQTVAGSGTALTASAVLGALILLAAPSVLLGMVSPYAVRLATRDVDHVGRNAGMLSALSTVGSIAGTFLAGFVLIPLLSISAILFGLGLALLLLAVFRWQWKAIVLSIVCVLATAAFFAADAQVRAEWRARGGMLEEIETPYASAIVRSLPTSPWGTGVLLLQIDTGFHSAMFPHDPSKLVFPYTRFYRLVEAARPDAGRALLIGGGAYTVARDFLARHPESRLDVVEIDPGTTALARKYFALQDDPRLTITHEDARLFINRAGPPSAPGEGKGAYQAVFGDAFRSLRTVPFHLTTIEAARGIAGMLDDKGVYLINVIATREGDASRLLRSQVKTLQAVFPSVLVFQVPFDRNEGRTVGIAPSPTQFTNFLLVASKAPLSIEQMRERATGDVLAYLDAFIGDLPTDDVEILRDDYAPVEWLLQS